MSFCSSSTALLNNKMAPTSNLIILCKYTKVQCNMPMTDDKFGDFWWTGSRGEVIPQSDYRFTLPPSEPACNYLHNEGESTRCGNQVSYFGAVITQHLEPGEAGRHVHAVVYAQCRSQWAEQFSRVRKHCDRLFPAQTETKLTRINTWSHCSPRHSSFLHQAFSLCNVATYWHPWGSYSLNSKTPFILM